MKKFLSWLGASKKAAKPTNRPVKGITEAEWLQAYQELQAEYDAARERQKFSDSKPSAYMRGINKAMEILVMHVPHVVAYEEVK